MNVIPLIPNTYHFTNCPARIDEDSHHMLLVVMSELVTIRERESDPKRVALLQASIKRLAGVLTRFELAGGSYEDHPL